MATVQWKSAASGNWTDASDWDSGTAPGVADDAVLSVSGFYTVALTTPISVASITIGDTSAFLQIEDPGGDDVASGNVANSGTIGFDTGGAGGSTLTVGGGLTNSNIIQVGNGGMTASSLLSVGGGFTNTGAALDLTGGQTGRPRNGVTGAPSSGTTGSYSIVGNAGGASLQFGSGGIAQIGDGASDGGDLYIDGADASPRSARPTATAR